MVKIKLNTGEGQVNFTTKKVVGDLNCVIVEVDSSKKEEENNPLTQFLMSSGLNFKVDIIIESSLGYLILYKNQLEGVNYFAPRVKITPPEMNLKDMLTFDKFKLNEKLLITVIGPKNTDVTLRLRID